VLPEMKWKLFVFDFDGVLVDSYSCLPLIYEHLAKRFELGKRVSDFVQRALTVEDMQDAKGNFDRRKWWPTLFGEFALDPGEAELNESLEVFWEHRIRLSTIMEGALELLVFLKERGSKTSIMCEKDGQTNMKKNRIRESGLSRFFERILIVGEDVSDRRQGFSLLFEEFQATGNETVIIEDKPSPIDEARRINNSISTVKVDFDGPLRLAWSGECVSSFRIRSLVELKSLIER
jgi:putative hydrolase of the HAD superfamily